MPSPPVKPHRPRGRPRKDVPTGTWVDSDVLARRVKAIVGNRDERLDDGANILGDLQRLARRLLRRPLSPEERAAVRALVLIKREPASVITRTLVAWRHSLGERDVRRMIRSLHVTLDAKDQDVAGQSIDANGRPATPKPRPRVKLIYR